MKYAKINSLKNICMYAQNGEFQVYQNNRSNSYVKYGKLYIKPTLTADKFGEDFLYEGNLQLGGPAPADQ